MANPNPPKNDPNDATDDEGRENRSADHNKAGHQPLTPRNEPRRTPESRHDRESQVGSGNQSQSRRGGGTRP
ncbi:hypothetical protein [Variovorax sp. EBFNA2]|uniref:hypothetical protein n=1 Tax=Variovorax sp. EBFNA2 TaxID=3342097 RepID=UPI0029BFDE71|nr:hypothetical protein [Variovorax boronicumulans]WPG39548.1 hypothetical protein RZE79_09455 [Variovorax boronicumulans]